MRAGVFHIYLDAHNLRSIVLFRFFVVIALEIHVMSGVKPEELKSLISAAQLSGDTEFRVFVSFKEKNDTNGNQFGFVIYWEHSCSPPGFIAVGAENFCEYQNLGLTSVNNCPKELLQGFVCCLTRCGVYCFDYEILKKISGDQGVSTILH
jgi:hypothetical protein